MKSVAPVALVFLTLTVIAAADYASKACNGDKSEIVKVQDAENQSKQHIFMINFKCTKDNSKFISCGPQEAALAVDAGDTRTFVVDKKQQGNKIQRSTFSLHCLENAKPEMTHVKSELLEEGKAYPPAPNASPSSSKANLPTPPKQLDDFVKGVCTEAVVRSPFQDATANVQIQGGEVSKTMKFLFTCDWEGRLRYCRPNYPDGRCHEMVAGSPGSANFVTASETPKERDCFGTGEFKELKFSLVCSKDAQPVVTIKK